MTVAIVKTTDPKGAREAVQLLGGMRRFISEGDRVILKPNICVGKPSSTGVVTDPEVVAEVGRMVQEAGGRPVVGESPIYPIGGKNPYPKAGYGDFLERYGIEFAAFDREESVHVQVPQGKCLDHQVIAKRVLQSDKLINIPVAKTHGIATVSLSLKNLKGVVPGMHKQIIHIAGLDEGIVDLSTIVRSHLIVIDGIIGLEGPLGPTHGPAVPLGVILAADNVVEADAAMCRIMGIDPEKVPHIRLAAERGLGRLEGFEILGESIEKVARPFRHRHPPGFFKAIFSTGVGKLSTFLYNFFARIRGVETVRPRLKLGEIKVDSENCNRCRLCVTACPVKAITLNDRIEINRSLCIRCFICGEVCPVGVFSIQQ